CDTNAAERASNLLANLKITATAKVGGAERVKDVNSFEKIKLGEAAKLVVWVEPAKPATTNEAPPALSQHPLEITIAPGETTSAWIDVRRHDFDDLATFDARNLPH